DFLFDQAKKIQSMPTEKQASYEARLQEIKVVLIRSMISEQLAYINIAKKWFDIDDLIYIRERKIGWGKIGGKAAGMLLAQNILEDLGDKDIKESLYIPDSYFLGADVMYSYMSHNDLMHWAEQKYKPAEQIRSEYPQLEEEYLAGEFPQDLGSELSDLLEKIGDQPIIVRSSSLLEDSFGTSFAGKYASHFCPNQGTSAENYHNFCRAIAGVYASALGADPLLYRRAKGLQDYDERIAILIQVVQGARVGRYYMPHASGVAFSRNLFRWSPQIRREDGFLRLVWGLGTRAVDRVGDDYPRLVALSHPQLRAEPSPKEIRRYSQHYVDVLDLEDNEFKTLPILEAIDKKDPVLRYVVQRYHDDYLSPLRSALVGDKVDELVVTLDELLTRTPLADKMRRMLNVLEENYHSPVDMEFTVHIRDATSVNSDVDIYLLQCRPQSHLQETAVRLPSGLADEDIVFSTTRVIPHGQVQGIRYVLFVTPEGYFSLPDPAARSELGRAISRLNAEMEDEVFICVGPGRWGTTNPDMGVRIGYSDIYHSRALVELSGEGVGSAPEPSYGTHFFQDLIESNIFPLAVYLDDKDAVFNRKFFYETTNSLEEANKKDVELGETLRLIKVADFRSDHHLDLVMDDEAGRAVAYLVKDHKTELEEQV
ncbi:MAG: PEP/pyruvate-binding domain-containing protein, partial [Chloroflexi bacterium]|nr:PEP/pyruvate-binding domain-containing protein [Chloroflexota bacterium]